MVCSQACDSSTYQFFGPMLLALGIRVVYMIRKLNNQRDSNSPTQPHSGITWSSIYDTHLPTPSQIHIRSKSNLLLHGPTTRTITGVHLPSLQVMVIKLAALPAFAHLRDNQQ
ncbi:hypothetical protein EJ05DRAFT_497357 [Pseudovirgaria hyperparasitica]|uniref:Uncharacterized protein n=1 Tax=Pseudovirgaria hyperparasitica TaxID=470096 RepID=A0A6A6WFH3_9PEZI|nr:uncharacterized protein EJ05DRAFT_497357 [Pseudovirgaria hyperparasitica]KAF2760794.1 hypothetical protein EJ05DRAFT_497357 [Pseudovirgaria hyperparasitica]